MNITISLPDPKRCKGCPCIGRASWFYSKLRCNRGYWTEWGKRAVRIDTRPRPAQCIEEHGE